MKNIAGIIIFCFLLFPCLCLAQVRVGITGGSLMAGTTLDGEYVNIGIYAGSQSYSPFEFSGKTRSRLGYFGGVALDFPLSKSMSLRTVISFSSKGWMERVSFKQDSSETIDDPFGGRRLLYDETFIINYLEIPALLTFYAPVGKTWLVFSGGPYLGIALTGKYKFHVIESNRNYNDSSGTIKFGNYTNRDYIDNGQLVPDQGHITKYNFNANRIDYGAAMNVGLELRNGLFFDFSLRIGLTDVMGNRYPYFPNRNRVMGLGVGYYFKKRISVKSEYDPYE